MAKKIRVPKKQVEAIQARLHNLARVAAAFVDGEAFQNVVPEGVPPSGDDYRVNEGPFIEVKKSLMRLKLVDDTDVSAIAWRRLDEENYTALLAVDPHPDRGLVKLISGGMTKAFAGEQAAASFEVRGFPCYSVFVPVRNSMDDVVGVVEVYGSLAPDMFAVDILAEM